MFRLKAVSLALMAVLGGCGVNPLSEPVHRMGELTTVGPLNYTVLETDWRAQIGEAVEARVPENKFLMVRLTITNAGNQQVAVPLLNLEDEKGNTYLELSDAKGVPNWLGLLRILEPSATMQGTLVFDVAPRIYRLRVTDGGDLESERTALIEIPLTLTPPSPMEPPPQPGQSF